MKAMSLKVFCCLLFGCAPNRKKSQNNPNLIFSLGFIYVIGECVASFVCYFQVLKKAQWLLSLKLERCPNVKTSL